MAPPLQKGLSIILWILLQIIVSHSQVQTYAVKSVILSPSNMNEDGASITSLKDVTTRTNSFDIFVSDQIGFHMRMDLDNTWGFHPTKASSIRVILDSSTPPNLVKPLGLFLAFTVHDPNHNIDEQFALLLQMDNHANNKISPECISPLYFIQRDILEEVNEIDPDIYKRQDIIMDYTDYAKISPAQKDVEPNQWPKEFWLDNDVNADTFTIQVHNHGAHNLTQSCQFNTGYPPQQGITMFIAADDDGEVLNITSITVEYHYETTWKPSTSPTKPPTKTPTETPISNPTPSPTGNPTIINNAIWNDDFKQDTSGTTGWDIFESTYPPGIKEYYTPDPNPMNITDWGRYHGPFFWHNAGGLLWMQRYFRCATASDVYLYYNMAFCETGSGDKVRSYYINQTAIHVVNNGQAAGTGTDITDATVLAQLSPVCNTMNNIPATYPWQYKVRQGGGVQINDNGLVNAGDVFLVSLSQGADAVGEATILFDIKVECRQAPTSNPTPAPTDNPTKTPSAVTIAPTTDPTPTPTDQPTPSPTSDPTPAPSLDPTPSPTNQPTPSPTADPTPAPSLDPTPAPTVDPTPSPTHYPTKNPTETPSLPPTKPDRNNMCTSDSATLILSFDYTLKNDITSKNEVKNTLSDAGDTFIKAEMNELTDCIATNYSLHIELSDNSQKAIINATICFECDDDDFEIEYKENDLNKKFVDIVDSMAESLSIITNSTNIDVDANEHKDAAVDDDTTTTGADTDDFDSKDEEAKKQEFQSMITNNLTMVIVGVSGIMLICCIVLFAFILKKKRKKGKREYNEGNSAEMKKVTSVSMTDMHDVITNAIHPASITPCTPNITTSLHTTSPINTAEAEPDHDDDIYLRGASSISTIGGITVGSQQSPKIGPVSNDGMDMNMMEDDNDDGGDLPDERSDHESDNDLYLETNMRTDDGGYNGMNMDNEKTPNGMDDDLGEANFDNNNMDGFIAHEPEIQENGSNEDSDDDYDALYRPNSVITEQ